MGSRITKIVLFKSNKEIYAQLVDDKEEIKTLVSASSREKGVDAKGTKTEVSEAVGKAIATKALAAGMRIFMALIEMVSCIMVGKSSC